MKAKPRMLAPSECNTEDKLRQLKRDLTQTDYASMYMSFCSPKRGVIIHDGAGGRAHLGLADMRKFARWFLRKQRCK